jgi:TolB-like protein/Tfp pilus assembly protein PilF
MLLLALGLPVAMTFAWYHGELASRRISGPELTIIAILLAMGSLFFYVLVRPAEEVIASRAPAVQQAGVAAARNAAADPHSAISLAVLPFVNLSSEKEQEFFSDGMTEEITAALAKVPDLQVVARTSAFEFKGKNINIKTMGEQLGATHLIEGSVRKAGNRLRITAQLIKADDGRHIWAEDYDRELTDVFAIQEDIARAITASLHMTLGLKPGQNLVNNRNIDAPSHEKFLRAQALYRARGEDNIENAIALLKQVVADNPAYAPAWAAIARAYTTLPNYLPALQAVVPPLEALKQDVISSRENAMPAAQKAIQLDPNLSDGYAALGAVEERAGQFILGQEHFEKALALDPNNADALAGYGSLLNYVGHAKEALAPMKQAHALEPFIPILSRDYAIIRWLNGDDAAALEIFRAYASVAPAQAAVNMAIVLAGERHFQNAADTLAASPPPERYREAVKEAVRLLRVAPNKAKLSDPPMGLGALDFVYVFVGAPERVLPYYERNIEAGWMSNVRTTLLWGASYSPVRKTERFKAMMRKAGYVDYWKARGWPDACHPVGGDDFACE